jgi:hypothetical protein
VGGKSHTLYGWNKVSRAIVLGKLKGVRRKDKGGDSIGSSTDFHIIN